jgi:NTE family protein
MFGPARRTWVLGGGGARGAAQVGVLQALFEANLEAPVAIVGTSVGALNGASIAAYPSLAGTMMLREVWMSRPALSVFQAHPLGLVTSIRRDQLSAFPQQNVKRLIDRAQALTGVTTFEQLRVPLAVVATDLNAGKPAVFRSGDLTPALLASTAIPGVFPMVRINDRVHLDGGVVQNTPLNIAVEDGAREILAISLMGGGEREQAAPAGFGELIARTLQLSLHHQMLSDYERLRQRCRIVVFCPITAPTATWEMKREHLESVMESSRAAMAQLLHQRGSKLFRHSGIHYLPLS